LRALGRLDAALAQYDQAIERFPTDAVGYRGRAETLRALGRLDAALAQYDQAIERFPTDAIGYRGRAETLRAMGRLDAALAQYDQAIERFPTEAVGYNGRAETLRALGRLDAALAQYDQAISRFPENRFSKNGRAFIMVLKGDFDGVRSELTIPNIPETVADWIAKGILATADLREGKIETAITQLNEAVASCPFPAQKKVFVSVLAVARLRLSRRDEREIDRAAEQIELLKPAMVTPEERGVVLLLSAHIAGARRDRSTAQRLIQEAQNVVSFEDFAKRRLESGLIRRYQLFDQATRPLTRNEQDQLDNDVFEAEILAVAA
jgi:tetratricopeptide (TPR) repeat protein